MAGFGYMIVFLIACANLVVIPALIINPAYKRFKNLQLSRLEIGGAIIAAILVTYQVGSGPFRAILECGGLCGSNVSHPMTSAEGVLVVAKTHSNGTWRFQKRCHGACARLLERQEVKFVELYFVDGKFKGENGPDSKNQRKRYFRFERADCGQTVSSGKIVSIWHVRINPRTRFCALETEVEQTSARFRLSSKLRWSHRSIPLAELFEGSYRVYDELIVDLRSSKTLAMSKEFIFSPVWTNLSILLPAFYLDGNISIIRRYVPKGLDLDRLF